MSTFGLIRPFDIDDGQLDGLSQQECFVLGYELAMIDMLLTKPDGFTASIHAENAERVKDACAKAGHPCSASWMSDDASEDWMTLSVGKRKGS